jgi:hypothetical protein
MSFAEIADGSADRFFGGLTILSALDAGDFSSRSLQLAKRRPISYEKHGRAPCSDSL